MNQYFENNVNIISNRKEISFRFFDVIYRFVVDNGVFSKEHIDYGTLALLKQVTKQPLSGTVCDMGCGYGVVGIILKSMFNQSEVFGFDVNERAVELAKINATLNKQSIDFYVASQLDRICDHVVFNPPIRAGKDVYYKLFEQAYDCLSPQGKLWVVMRKSHGVESAMRECEKRFKRVELLKKDKGHYVFLAQKDLSK